MIQFFTIRLNIYIYFLILIFLILYGMYLGLKYLYDGYVIYRFQTKLFRFLKKRHTKKMDYAAGTQHRPGTIRMGKANPLNAPLLSTWASPVIAS